MIGEHIRRNVCYFIFFNQADAESVYWAVKMLQIDERNSKLLSSLIPGTCVFRQTQSNYSNAFLAEIDFIQPARNIGEIEYNTHALIPATDEKTNDEIIRKLEQSIKDNKPESKKKTDIEELALKLITLWAKNPYTSVARLFEQLGSIHHKIQFEIREFIEEQQWAKFKETRIGRSNILLMELTPEGYQTLGVPLPEENKGGGGIEHRYFAQTIKSHFEDKGVKAYLEQIVQGTNHRVDVAVEDEDGINAHEICVTITDNLASHAEACFEKSNAIKILTIVVATKTKLKEVKKQIKSNLMLARFEDRIQVDIIENYMKGN